MKVWDLILIVHDEWDWIVLSWWLFWLFECEWLGRDTRANRVMLAYVHVVGKTRSGSHGGWSWCARDAVGVTRRVILTRERWSRGHTEGDPDAIWFLYEMWSSKGEAQWGWGLALCLDLYGGQIMHRIVWMDFPPSILMSCLLLLM